MTATDWSLAKNQTVSAASEVSLEGDARIYESLRHFWHPVMYADDLVLMAESEEDLGNFDDEAEAARAYDAAARRLRGHNKRTCNFADASDPPDSDSDL